MGLVVTIALGIILAALILAYLQQILAFVGVLLIAVIAAAAVFWLTTLDRQDWRAIGVGVAVLAAGAAGYRFVARLQHHLERRWAARRGRAWEYWRR